MSERAAEVLAKLTHNPITPEEVRSWFESASREYVPTNEQCALISHQLDIIGAVPGITDKKRGATPIADAFALLAERIPEAIEHWKAEASAGRLTEGEHAFRNGWLTNLGNATRLASVDWLLEVVPRPVELQHHVRARAIAEIIAKAYRAAGRQDIGDHAEAPLVKVVTAALKRIGDSRVTETGISKYLRDNRPQYPREYPSNERWGRPDQSTPPPENS